MAGGEGSAVRPLSCPCGSLCVLSCWSRAARASGRGHQCFSCGSLSRQPGRAQLGGSLWPGPPPAPPSPAGPFAQGAAASKTGSGWPGPRRPWPCLARAVTTAAGAAQNPGRRQTQVWGTEVRAPSQASGGRVAAAPPGAAAGWSLAALRGSRSVPPSSVALCPACLRDGHLSSADAVGCGSAGPARVAPGEASREEQGPLPGPPSLPGRDSPREVL